LSRAIGEFFSSFLNLDYSPHGAASLPISHSFISLLLCCCCSWDVCVLSIVILITPSFSPYSLLSPSEWIHSQIKRTGAFLFSFSSNPVVISPDSTHTTHSSSAPIFTPTHHRSCSHSLIRYIHPFTHSPHSATAVSLPPHPHPIASHHKSTD
jgi:hypothetical protein